MITADEWIAIKAAARRDVEAAPPLTPEQRALVCELFAPITLDDLIPREEPTNHAARHTPTRTPSRPQ